MVVSHTCSKCSTCIHTGAQHLAVHRRRLTRPVCEKTTFLRCAAKERLQVRKVTTADQRGYPALC